MTGFWLAIMALGSVIATLLAFWTGYNFAVARTWRVRDMLATERKILEVQRESVAVQGQIVQMSFEAIEHIRAGSSGSETADGYEAATADAGLGIFSPEEYREAESQA
jgi:hypothetical protein